MYLVHKCGITAAGENISCMAPIIPIFESASMKYAIICRSYATCSCRYSIAVITVNSQMRSILSFHQFRPIQLFQTMLFPRQSTLISSLFYNS